MVSFFLLLFSPSYSGPVLFREQWSVMFTTSYFVLLWMISFCFVFVLYDGNLSSVKVSCESKKYNLLITFWGHLQWTSSANKGVTRFWNEFIKRCWLRGVPRQWCTVISSSHVNVSHVSGQIALKLKFWTTTFSIFCVVIFLTGCLERLLHRVL